MQKLQTILISVLVIVALFTSIYFPYKFKQLSNDFLDQTNQYGKLLNQINDLQREVRELKDGEIKKEKIIVLSPVKGDVWIIGEVYQIRWIPINPSKKVTIQLLDLMKRGTYQTIWSQEVLDNGIYQFALPSDLYPIKHAQLHIGNDLKSFFSEGFSIISKNETTDLQTYCNEEYGFEIIFPNRWKDYKVDEKDFRGVKSIDFKLERSNPLIFDDGHKEYYGSIFMISIYAKEEWEKEQTEEGPKPSYITENDKYIFAVSSCQDDEGFKGFPNIVHGEVYNGPLYDVGYKILSTFKFIE